jgi:UDP-glucose 4-epimerase
MKIGVTGANGFVGTALCRRLARSGHEVVKLVRHGGQPGAVAVGDIGPETDWSLGLEGCDLLVHLAARVHVMRERALNPQAEFDRVNFQGAAHLARAAVRAGVRRLVLMSTVKVHGERTDVGRPFRETDKPSPRGPYAVSKLAGELALQEACAGGPMEWVIIRPPLIYGPGVRANFAVLARAATLGLPLPLGAIENHRSMVSVTNLVDFVMCCLTHPLAANQHFLVSDDHDLSTPELVQQLAMAAGKVARLFSVPAPLMQFTAAMIGKSEAFSRLSDNLQVDIGKASSILGWRPEVSVYEGLQYLNEATQ